MNSRHNSEEENDESMGSTGTAGSRCRPATAFTVLARHTHAQGSSDVCVSNAKSSNVFLPLIRLYAMKTMNAAIKSSTMVSEGRNKFTPLAKYAQHTRPASVMRCEKPGILSVRTSA